MTPKELLLRSGLTAVGVLAASQIIPGIHFDSWPGLLIAALTLGLLNAFLRPLLLLLSLPLVIVSLGLFIWIINASLLYLVGWLVKSFHVNSFWSALGGAAVISLVSLLGAPALGLRPKPTLRVHTSSSSPNPIRPHHTPRPRTGPGSDSGPSSGSGPVIDV